MKIFIYYRENEKDMAPDIAAVRAKSINAAVRILDKYYNNIDKNNDVYELDFESLQKEDKDIIIISDYWWLVF